MYIHKKKTNFNICLTNLFLFNCFKRINIDHLLNYFFLHFKHDISKNKNEKNFLESQDKSNTNFDLLKLNRCDSSWDRSFKFETNFFKTIFARFSLNSINMISDRTIMYSSIFTLSILFYLVKCEEKLYKESASLKSKLIILFRKQEIHFTTIFSNLTACWKEDMPRFKHH